MPPEKKVALGKINVLDVNPEKKQVQDSEVF